MSAHRAATRRRGPRVRTLLLAVNAFALLVPAAAVVLLRIYENHLVQQTERRLIAESVLIGEAWRGERLRALGVTPREVGRIPPPGAGDERFFPLEPVVDLGNPLAASEPPATRRVSAAERVGPAWVAGRALEPVLHRAKLVNLSGVRVLDAQGCVVASTGAQVGDCLDHLPEVAAALRGRYHAVARPRFSDEPPPAFTSISRRGKVRVFTATPLLSDGRVIGVVRMSRTGLDPLTTLWKHRRILLWALAGSLLLTLSVSLFLARAIARPVREIRAAAEAIARGEPRRPGMRLGGSTPEEVRALSEALDTMTAQLTDRAEYIAEFAANVSHELKTPLTAVRGAAELLADDLRDQPARPHGMSAAQRQRFLSNIEADVDRMERLVTRLLHLARIQSAPAAAEPVALAPFFEALAARHGDRVHLHLGGETPDRLIIPVEHLESAIGNLLENALRHGAGRPVELHVGGEGGRLIVAVQDRGGGIRPKNQPRIFERFFTTERDRGGTGLGLAIVQAVARTRGGAVRFESGPEGTTFHLKL